MFEKASRLKLRFTTTRGTLNVEDLWNLPLNELDDLAIQLKGQLQSMSETFLKPKRTQAETLNSLRFEIVKHIISTLLEEEENKKNAAEKKAEKQKLLGILAEKKDEDLKGKSIKELEKMIDKL